MELLAVYPIFNRRRAISRTRTLIGIFVLIIVLTLLYKVQTKSLGYFEVTSESMRPTLEVGDRLWMAQPEAYKIGDIVVFENKEAHNDFLVKRIVAMPFDFVEIHEGHVFVNRQPVMGADPKALKMETSRSWDLEFDQYFVLGDNQRDSNDSRYFGPVRQAELRGIVCYRLGPHGRRGAVN